MNRQSAETLANSIKFMQLAADESAKNLLTGDGGPFGAAIIKDGELVAAGHNEVLKNNDPTCHAEVQTIRAACQKLGTFDLTGCILYTSCYPCPMCMGAIIWSNIKTVYYGNTAKDAADIGFRDDFIYDFIENGCKNDKVLSLTKTNRELTIKAFSDFKNKQDKKMY